MVIGYFYVSINSCVLIFSVCTLIRVCVVYKSINVCIYLQWVIFMCGKYLTLSHFPALRGSPWIAVDERESTHALRGELLYPTTPSAAPDASVGASVGAPQIGSRLVYLNLNCMVAFV